MFVAEGAEDLHTILSILTMNPHSYDGECMMGSADPAMDDL